MTSSNCVIVHIWRNLLVSGFCPGWQFTQFTKNIAYVFLASSTFKIVSSKVGYKVTEVRYIFGVGHILLWCNTDVNFCKDHSGSQWQNRSKQWCKADTTWKAEVPDPLALDDLISFKWPYKLNKRRKLARLITHYKNAFSNISEGTAVLLQGVRSERRLMMGVGRGWERNLFHIPWFWPIQETLPLILAIP